MKVPSKEEIKEEARTYRINEHDDGAFCGFIAGAEWMEQQLEPLITELGMNKARKAPQSVEVMTLEEILTCSKLDKIKTTDGGVWFSEWSVKQISELYASQFKAKAEQMQAELEKVRNSNAELILKMTDNYLKIEAERDSYKEALEIINGLNSRSDDRPDLFDATQIAYKALIKQEEALQSTKQ